MNLHVEVIRLTQRVEALEAAVKAQAEKIAEQEKKPRIGRPPKVHGEEVVDGPN